MARASKSKQENEQSAPQEPEPKKEAAQLDLTIYSFDELLSSRKKSVVKWRPARGKKLKC